LVAESGAVAGSTASPYEVNDCIPSATIKVIQRRGARRVHPQRASGPLFDAPDIRDAKTRLLRAVRPLDPSAAVRGQYEGYLGADEVAPGSRRETYAAARVTIDNWRWQGTPIFLRAGKALRRSVTEAVIRLKDAPHLQLDGRPVSCSPTLLVIRIQRSWAIVDPLLRSWEREGSPLAYARGSWGPGKADSLVAARGGGHWITSGEEPGMDS